MTDHEGCIRGYYRLNKAWGAKPGDKVEICVGMYHPDGGTSGEVSFVWDLIGKELCPQLKAYDDSWSALSLFGDLISKMGEYDSKLIQEDDFCELLDSLGFIDMTAYGIGKNSHSEFKV